MFFFDGTKLIFFSFPISAQTILNSIINERTAHDILLLIAYAQKPQINVPAEVSNGARCLNISMSIYLLTYYM